MELFFLLPREGAIISICKKCVKNYVSYSRSFVSNQKAIDFLPFFGKLLNLFKHSRKN